MLHVDGRGNLMTAVCFSCFYYSSFVGVWDFKLWLYTILNCLFFFPGAHPVTCSPCGRRLSDILSILYLFLSLYKVNIKSASHRARSHSSTRVPRFWMCSSFVLKTIFGELRRWTALDTGRLLFFVITTRIWYMDLYKCRMVCLWKNAPGFIIKPIFCTTTRMSF